MHAKTNSTLSEDPMESLQNDAVSNSSLRSADKYWSHIKYTPQKSWRFWVPGKAQWNSQK